MTIPQPIQVDPPLPPGAVSAGRTPQGRAWLWETDTEPYGEIRALPAEVRRWTVVGVERDEAGVWWWVREDGDE